MENRKQFTFYRSYYDAVKKMPFRTRMVLLEAVIVFALDGVEPVGLDKNQTVAFTLMRPNLETSRRRAFHYQIGKHKGEKENEKETEIENEKEKEIEKENEIESESDSKSGVGEGFQKFWNLYPVKYGREAAEEAWKECVKNEEAVMKGLRQWNRSRQWSRENGRFIPRAAKFLREEHYRQDPPGDVPMGSTGELGKAELEAIAAVMGSDKWTD